MGHRRAVPVVVVSHDSWSDLERALPALAAAGVDVTVVDAASTDGSQDLVERRFPAVRLHRLASNPGYGAAANRGIEASPGEYVLVMNADAWPVADAIEQLAAFADRQPSVGIAAPRLLWPDGSRQRSVFGYPRGAISLAAWAAFPSAVSRAYRAWQRLGGRRRGAGVAPATSVQVAEPQFVSGAVLLLRRTALDQVGLFDESFFMYSEETDLCRRMQRAGWGVAVVEEAAFVHAGGGSTKRQPDGMYGEQLLSYLRFFAKHHGLRRAERARRLLAAALLLRAALTFGDARPRGRRAARQLASAPVATLLSLRAASGEAFVETDVPPGPVGR